MACLVVVLFFILATVVGPQIWRVNREALDFEASMSGSTLKHPFGTDDLGRDILARSLYGGRVSLSVGLVAMLISIGVGTTIGAVSGFIGGLTDGLLMRLTDMFLALPQLPLLLLTIFLFRDALSKAFGPELGIFLLIVCVIGLLNWMGTARVVRASFLSLKQKEFVEAAHCLGIGRRSIMFKHILPNVLSPIIVATLSVGSAIITESVLSFLGLGFPSDVPTWGRMLYDAKDYIQFSPHEAMAPGVMIFLTVLSVNYIGDGLRDALDPHKSHEQERS
jgi:peptide/nickel transport system permease protein